MRFGGLFGKLRTSVLAARFRLLSGETAFNPLNAQHCMVFPERRLLFNRIKKSGNSSVAMYLHDIVHNRGRLSPGVDYKGTKRTAIDVTVAPFGMSAPELRRFDSFTCITVVRNPFTRLLSAYLDKGRSARAYYRGTPGFGAASPEGFAEFVTFLENGGLHANRHWWPQTDLLFLPVARYDFICRLETLDGDLRAALTKLGIEVPETLDLGTPHPAEVSSGRKVTSASKSVDRFYTADLRERVHRLYERDFAAFGYPRADAEAVSAR